MRARGNIAENAGGPRAFKYGVTREYVLGLEVLLVDGTRLRTGRRTVKGVTGYDVTALLVGSEGTLAVTTEATLRLIPRAPKVETLLALFADVRACGAPWRRSSRRASVPRCLELLDATTLDAVRARGVGVDARAGALDHRGRRRALVCEAAMERTGSVCADAGAIEVLVAQDEAQRDRLWEARRQLSPATRAMAKFKISEDVVVPRSRLVDLILETRKDRRGHGDPRAHLRPRRRRQPPRQLPLGRSGEGPRVVDALDRLFRAVVSMRGTLSGEHGIGTSKSEYLPLEQSAELIAIQRNLKAVFDPRGLLNPHKIFPRATHGAC